MKGITTKAIHSGYTPNEEDGAVIPPIHLSTTFEFGNKGGFYDGTVSEQEWKAQKAFKFNNDYEHYDYSRTANPTRIMLEKVIAALDGNSHALAFSSGSAALANIVALLKPKQSILFSSDAYGGTYRFIVRAAGEQGIGYRITDLTDPEQTEQALKQGGISIVWIETPTNPLLKVADIERLAALTHKYDAILVVDNTFATPVLQMPAKHGADIVVHSASKYLNGHSDVIAGVLSTSNDELYTRLKFMQNSLGAILAPFDSWLTLRGLKTLELRMKRHCENADAVVQLLTKHASIKRIYYPGLGDKSQAAIVKKQMSHPGAMVSFELQDGLDPQKFIASLTRIPLAESLGAVETLLDHPASMTHSAIPKEEREKIGLSDGLFRLSIGIENTEDLIEDISQALDALSKK